MAMSKKITWSGMDLYTHMLIVGPTRGGKTATMIKPLIYQLLKLKAKGVPLGLSVIEPKGDLAFMVREMSERLGLPFYHIDPASRRGYAIEAGYDADYPSDPFNPLYGDEDVVAEATVSVLKSLFGKQEAFFAIVQELSSRYTTKLLKRLYGNDLDLLQIVKTLRDPSVMKLHVQKLKERDGPNDLTDFFENELLGSLQDRYRQHVIGLRAQLENLTANSRLREVMVSRKTLDIDAHYEKGGILAVNTALGELSTSGDAFGQFVIMHLQAGAFRRGGTEKSRVPHFLIIDELSRYINPDFERFLSIAAEYRVAGIFATQSLAQLEVESGKLTGRSVKRAILNSCRNKVAFGGLGAEDAKELSEEFGRRQVIVRQATYKTRILVPPILPHDFRDTETEEPRFYYTQIMDGLPRFHFIAKLTKKGVTQPPAIGKGTFVPANWREEFDRLREEVMRRGGLSVPPVVEAEPAHPVLEPSQSGKHFEPEPELEPEPDPEPESGLKQEQEQELELEQDQEKKKQKSLLDDYF